MLIAHGRDDEDLREVESRLKQRGEIGIRSMIGRNNRTT